MLRGMNAQAIAVIDHLGGTSAVAKLIEAPTSTVHSWRVNGITPSRLAHLRLVANSIGKPLPDDLSKLPPPAEQAAA
jgi:hypothetical protein